MRTASTRPHRHDNVHSAEEVTRLPEPGRAYLADPCLEPVWAAIRTKLERGGLTPSGIVTIELNEQQVKRLNGTIGKAGKKLRPGLNKLKLADLDAALRASVVQAGLLTAVTDLTGSLLVDTSAALVAKKQQRSDVMTALDNALARAGCAASPWAPAFCGAARPVLARAGDQALALANRLGQVLAELVEAESIPSGPLDENSRREVFSATMFGELGELATRHTGSAHGLDDGEPLARLVLRAAATAHQIPMPKNARERRDLWELLGVSPDAVSGTMLTWGLRPPGADGWSAMMRHRADLGLVTHLTVQELETAGVLVPNRESANSTGTPTALVDSRTTVHVCENPQVVQAAARAGVRSPLLCTFGNPASVGWRLIDRLCRDGVKVAYHGDFDWPGVAIAGRIYRLGAVPWRMTSADYDSATSALPLANKVSLDGRAIPTPWDTKLTERMRSLDTAVHEEAIISTLLEDLAKAD